MTTPDDDALNAAKERLPGAGASQEAVARIARMHFYTGNGRCGCGWVYSVQRIDDDWASHVAAELMKLWEPKP